MNANGNNGGWIDGRRYNDNFNRFVSGELAKYAGQWVAVLADGTKVVAHHEDFLTLARLAEEAGYPSTDVVLHSVPPLDEVQL
jgi:hypothetical protein